MSVRKKPKRKCKVCHGWIDSKGEKQIGRAFEWAEYEEAKKSKIQYVEYPPEHRADFIESELNMAHWHISSAAVGMQKGGYTGKLWNKVLRASDAIEEARMIFCKKKPPTQNVDHEEEGHPIDICECSIKKLWVPE